MTLFPYQFDVIPVELISSIYEQFAHADPVNTDTGTETDVFYTRLSLVSLVLDEVMDGLTGAETVLDLTCGSGVFLVEALRRLVRLRANGGAPSRELIRSTLHGQIQGIDVSEAAVRVAAFSLYLAALELGYAFAMDRSVIMVCGEERVGRLPFDIQHRTVIKYTSESKGDFDSLEKKISERASKLLEKNEIRQMIEAEQLAPQERSKLD